MTTHATIDIETLDTSPTSVVLSIGACKFDPFTDVEPYDGRHWLISIDEQMDLGRTTSESTLQWWSKQDQSVRDATFTDEGRDSLNEFAKDLNKYLTGTNKIWAQGPQFDMVIIENLYGMIGMHCNWKFWQILDSRTLFHMMPKDPRKEIKYEAHNALADALTQSVCIQNSMKHFGVEKLCR